MREWNGMADLGMFATADQTYSNVNSRVDWVECGPYATTLARDRGSGMWSFVVQDYFFNFLAISCISRGLSSARTLSTMLARASFSSEAAEASSVASDVGRLEAGATALAT